MTTLYRLSVIASAIMVQGIITQTTFAANKPLAPQPTTPAVAAPENTPQPVTALACISIESSATRLECYDTALGRKNEISEAPQQAQSATAKKNTKNASTEANFFDVAAADKVVNPSTSLLDRRWELSPESKLGIISLRSNRPVYILPLFYNDNPNKSPTSANPLNTAKTDLNFDDTETKFQLSLKAKIVEGVFGNYGDIWVGYTQTSRWQILNSENSRPFRETNYEPEVSLILPTNYNFFGLNGRLFGLTLNHQSNGRSSPLSRSWNRAILNVGLERENWVIMLRPWYRIPETKSEDDNPYISNYIGRGDLQITRKWNNQEFSLMLRHSLKGGENSHGAAQLDWSFPINNNLRGFAQVFNGYGESLIDYNHRSTYFGLGISLLNWY
ncbi:MAG TPA: phospholipase A [Aquirhabdus sp.]